MEKKAEKHRAKRRCDEVMLVRYMSQAISGRVLIGVEFVQLHSNCRTLYPSSPATKILCKLREDFDYFFDKTAT